MSQLRSLSLATFSAALVAACASNGVEGPSVSFIPAGENSHSAATGTAPLSGGGGYAMSAAELDMDCKKLTGRIQIRILELRTYASATPPSALSRGIQAATSPILSGSSAGIDPNGEHARSLAQVQAYNSALVEKDCRSFDLTAALASHETPPSPSMPPRSKMAPPMPQAGANVTR